MGQYFEEVIVGDVFSFGAEPLRRADVDEFRNRYAPFLPEGADPSPRKGELAAAQSHIYALWARMLYEFTEDWPIVARIGQDQLRWYKTAFSGDVLNARMTILAKESARPEGGVVTAQHEVLNQDGELVMSLMSRAVVAYVDA